MGSIAPALSTPAFVRTSFFRTLVTEERMVYTKSPKTLNFRNLFLTER